VFWAHLFEFLNIIHTGAYAKVFDEHARMDSVPTWFEGVNLNFAENLLYSRSRGENQARQGTKGKEDDKIAVTEVGEGGAETRKYTWGQLRRDVRKLGIAMKQHGVRKGDRIAVIANNTYDTLKIVLACAALGGIFSTSSTDMGTRGILDRLNQTEPKVRELGMRLGGGIF
jgi:acetoacetyl-CoA synthetase